jgi:hypothetical protein
MGPPLFRVGETADSVIPIPWIILNFNQAVI